MGWLWGIGFIAVMALIIWIANKVGRELIRVIIYILTIPLWIGVMIYYNDIRTYILFGAILAFEVLCVYIYGKDAGWFKRRTPKTQSKPTTNNKPTKQTNCIYCRKCGKQIPADSVFCDKCGTQVVK